MIASIKIVDILITLGTLLGGSAAIVTAIIYFTKKILDSALDQALEKYKSRLSQESADHQAVLNQQLEDYKSEISKELQRNQSIIDMQLEDYKSHINKESANHHAILNQQLEDYKSEISKELQKNQSIIDMQLEDYKSHINKEAANHHAILNQQLEDYKSQISKELEQFKITTEQKKHISQYKFDVEFKIIQKLFGHIYFFTDKSYRVYYYVTSQYVQEFDKQFEIFGNGLDSFTVDFYQNCAFINQEMADNFEKALKALHKFYDLAQDVHERYLRYRDIPDSLAYEHVFDNLPELKEIWEEINVGNNYGLPKLTAMVREYYESLEIV